MADAINQVRGVGASTGSSGAGPRPSVGAAAARANGGGCCGDSAPCCETQDSACCSSEEGASTSKQAAGVSGAAPGQTPSNLSLFDWFQALLRGKDQDANNP